MDIRRAAPEDRRKAEALFEARGLPVLHSGIASSAVLVVPDGERIVGSAAIEVAARVGLSVWLAVEKDREGEGLGTSLLRSLLARAQELGLRKLFVITPGEAELFVAAGFSRVEEADLPREIRSMRGYPADVCGEGGTILGIQLETRV